MIQYLFMGNDQTHPLHETDKNIIDSLINKKIPEDLDYINLARLINRYNNFPGEIEIKNDIEKILNFSQRGLAQLIEIFLINVNLFKVINSNLCIVFLYL